MRQKLLLLALALLSLSANAQVKPVTGTFVNFFWQDERNNYMNQRDVDQTDPERWACKTAELHEMGVDYLVFMAVANEGAAIYPSKFMPHAYPEGRKSPIDAIMDTADKLGMHVIVSTGWARNQLDDLADPYVIETQRKIMEELAELYGTRASFYGWYLPVEGCFIPYLSDHAVQGVNKIAARARELTPNAKVLISPYGTFAAEFENPKFAQSIYDLDVDIIAYQDEIGCVRETFPMANMKEHFRLLGEIHKKCDIEFWANVESFTWDREPNNWYSTLVPAAFGRYLSQIVGVSASGVDRIISFAIAGIYDTPGSEYPCGQKILSTRVQQDYMAWLAGDERWKLLEGVFAGQDFGKHIVKCGPQGLGDGVFAVEDPKDPNWHTFEGGVMECVIDLEAKKEVKRVAAHFCDYFGGDIAIPQNLEVLVSDNGKQYRQVASVCYEAWPNKYLDCWTDVILASGLSEKARYVKVVARLADSTQHILCSEVIVE